MISCFNILFKYSVWEASYCSNNRRLLFLPASYFTGPAYYSSLSRCSQVASLLLWNDLPDVMGNGPRQTARDLKCWRMQTAACNVDCLTYYLTTLFHTVRLITTELNVGGWQWHSRSRGTEISFHSIIKLQKMFDKIWMEFIYNGKFMNTVNSFIRVAANSVTGKH
jgi:hypothetical protein